ncbi:MAG: hypothetical protein ABJF07_07615 [Nisaea sp.]|uniref:COG3904 family protein n=1 Tax=Nisaea sp. TaxID=2024842 RepID=UPI0032666C4D
MTTSHLVAITLAALAISTGTTATALSADIRLSLNDTCAVSLTGELKPGDYEAFIGLVSSAFPADYDESTAANTVCLNSPGGNLAEGVKFARHFYKEGVGTVVPDGAECFSACAVMFMMGTAQGPEVAFANRKLHVRGTVGFHRPYLDLPSGSQVDQSLMGVAYDRALESALDLISVANSKAPWTSDPMMRPDLIQAMLSHVGNDMYVIDTIDKAGRFGVEIVGADLKRELSEEVAYYACHNALQWQHGLTDEDITYTAKEAEPVEGYRTVRPILAKDGTTAFEVFGNKDGYAVHRCVVAQTNSWVSACGTDDYTSTKIGRGECDPSEFPTKLDSISPLSLHNPRTRLASLAAGAAATSPPLAAAGNAARCFVREGGAVKDDEPCELVPGRTVEGWDMASFIWPSGGRTVVVVKPGSVEINGVRTIGVDTDEFGRCYPNSRTGREFCVSVTR